MKQAIIVRTDLKMGKGKLITEAVHASLGALKKAKRADITAWETEGGKKVVLKVACLKELAALHKRAEALRLPCFVVRDAGLTQVETGSVTALGIGPAADERVDRVTRELKLL